MKSTLTKLFVLLLILTGSTQIKAQQKLIHYWHFNNLVNFTSVAVPTATIPAIKANYSTLDTNKAILAFQILAGTAGNVKTYWDNTTGDTLNARLGLNTTIGLGFRPRNPTDSMQLVMYTPSIGYQNISFRCEFQRSSSGNGAPAVTYDYSTDSGATWKNTGLNKTIDSTGVGNWVLGSSISNADPLAFNNPRLAFRIRFNGPTNVGTSGNVRIDNITFDGDTFIAGPAGPPFYNLGQITTTNPVTGNPDSLNVKATFRGTVYGFNQRTTGVQFLVKDNTGGTTVFHASKNFGYTVAEGDSIQVTGTVTTFRGLEEVAPDTIIKLASGRPLKLPVTITTLNEFAENNLVKMNNLTFYTTPTGGIWPTASTNVLCRTVGQNDTIQVRILATAPIAGTALPTSGTFSVIGMGTQFSTSSAAPFAFNGYQLMPRTSSDIISGIANPDSVIISGATTDLSSMTITWNKPASYVDANMSTLVFLKQGSAITNGTNNKNASYYTANSVFTSNGTAYQNDAAAKCVMNSDNNTVTITGLAQNTNYYAIILTVRTADSVYSGASAINALTKNNLPAPVTNLNVTPVSQTAVLISWAKPASYVNNTHHTIAFVKADNAITAGTPARATAAYTANSVFKSGSTLSFDAAAYCTYNGDSNFVLVTGLDTARTYNVNVWVDRDADSTYATATSAAGTTFPRPAPPATGGKFVIHYWHFNNLSGAAQVIPIPALKADTSLLDTNKATIQYAQKPGTSNSYAAYMDNVAGDTTNAKFGYPAGNGARFRNPSDSMVVLFRMPTTGFKNVVLRYASQSSSTGSGMRVQLFDYSTNNGTSWTTKGLTKLYDSTDVNYKLVAIPLNGDTAINNNPNFIFRITFQGNTTGASGNNRFDNVSLEGDTAGYKFTKPTGLTQVLGSTPELTVYPNPSEGQFTLNTNLEGRKTITVMNIAGQVVYENTVTETETNINLGSQSRGMYFVRISGANATSTKTIKLILN